MPVTVCPVGELPPGASRVVTAGGREVVVFNLDGDLYAMDNRCAHKEQPIADGVVKDGIITCPAHLWRFDVTTGRRTDAPGWSISCHPVAVEGTDIVVTIPERPPALPIREQLLAHARDWSRDA